MKKAFIVTKDITLATFRPVGSNMPQRNISFEAGETVVGTPIGTEIQFLEVSTPEGKVHFFLTGAHSVIIVAKEGINPESYKKLKENKEEVKPTDTYKLPIKKIVIGIGVIVGIGILIKLVTK